MSVPTSSADRGRHRGPSTPDLVIAAAAECAGLVYVDKDFDVIAQLTGQPVERLVLSHGNGPDGNIPPRQLRRR
ncbi:hypothetical protein [Pseudonocardia spinosispora]|uniref:hypothetical protein n=1 Tax=Pseudonocardia spinosispora TaxID=103441 RepID=UPI00040E267C|nr:hypothetical protein [Pseudonocardia spinosispora]